MGHCLRKGPISDGDTKPKGLGEHGGVTLLEKDPVQFGNYTLLPRTELGRGTYGRVMEAKENKTERRVAIKVYDDIDEASRETRMYQCLQILGGHRCVLPLLEYSTTLPTPYMVLPSVPGASVRNV